MSTLTKTLIAALYGIAFVVPVAHPAAMVRKLRDRILEGTAGAERALAREEMAELAAAVDLANLDLGTYRRFQESSYARNRVFLNDHVELAVICWRSGQSSAIHDHGESHCLYLVVEGVMLEERFRLNGSGEPEPADERSFGRGNISVSAGHEIHRIHNRAGTDLVTVHIYSPPLGNTMKLFTPIPRGD
jgi:cysteine dioxygenase